MQTRSKANLEAIDIKELLLERKRPSLTIPTVPTAPLPVVIEPSVHVERVVASNERPRKVAKQDIYSTHTAIAATSSARQHRRAQAKAKAEGRTEDESDPDAPNMVWVSSSREDNRPQENAQLTEAYGIIQAQSELIIEQRSLIAQLRNELDLRDAALTQPDAAVMLVLDTESFTFRVEGSELLLPLQLGWGIYRWDEECRELCYLHHRTVYVSELMCVSEYRATVKGMSERCFERHEQKMASTNFPLMTGAQALEALMDDLDRYLVRTIVGYNLSWDFQAIGNLRHCFVPMESEAATLSPFADNPFNPLGLNYLDLMHQTVKSYGAELVFQGIRDGTVHRAASSERILLKRNQRYGKSVYSAEYVLQHFFSVKQNHMADDDVRYEALLLEKCLLDSGLLGVEYNIFYPQQSCYQRLIHLARPMLELVEEEGEDSFVVPDGEGEEEEIGSSDDLEVANMLRTLSATLVQPRVAKNDEEEEECLFVVTEEEEEDDEDSVVAAILAGLDQASSEEVLEEPASNNDK